MAALPKKGDPTLAAVDAAIESEGNAKESRGYFGTHSCGEECSRKAWLTFRLAAKPHFDAVTLKRFSDGHFGEELQAVRLNAVDGVDLQTYNPETGQQFGFTACRGHMGGHCDGKVTGLLQAPKTLHIWEHKQTADKKQKELEKAIKDHGEPEALKAWDAGYYAQAQAYMHQFKAKRHYLTCATPGGRKTISVRTHYDKAFAESIFERAERIIFAPEPTDLNRVSTDETFFKCKWCDYSGVCYGHDFPLAGCRTCTRSTPVDDGQWHCDKWDSVIPMDGQRIGCEYHTFIPSIVPQLTLVDAGDDWVEYEDKAGRVFRNGREYVRSQELADAGLAAASVEVMALKKQSAGG